VIIQAPEAFQFDTIDDVLKDIAAGKIVICTRGTYDRVAKSAEVKRAGGVGMPVYVEPVAGMRAIGQISRDLDASGVNRGQQCSYLLRFFPAGIERGNNTCRRGPDQFPDPQTFLLNGAQCADKSRKTVATTD